MRRADLLPPSSLFQTTMSGSSASTVDTQGPTLVNGPDGSSYLADGKLVLTFNEPIFWGTGSYYVMAGGNAVSGGHVYMNTEVWISGNTLTITPFYPLQYSTTYTVMFSHDAVTDAAGNRLPGDSAYPLLFEFTTVASPPSVTRTGTAAADILYGSDYADTLNGDAGGDTLFGLGGDDILDGDGMASGAGGDRLHGGAGDDILRGGAGRDQLIGGSGNDLLEGGADDDFLTDDEGRNTLLGGDGNDSLSSQAGATGKFDGGEGNDSLSGNSGVDMEGGGGDDKISIWLSSETPSYIDGGSGNDTLQAMLNDRVKAQLTMTGGAGIDTFSFTGNTALDAGLRVRVTDFAASAGERLDIQGLLPAGYTGNPFADGSLRLLAQDPDTLLQRRLPGETGYQTVVELTGVRPAQLSAANFAGGLDPAGTTRGLTLTGTEGPDTLIGGTLDDTLRGLGGRDLLNGSTGNDQLEGGWGNDELVGGDGDDRLDGGEEDDKLYGGNGSDHLIGGWGQDTLNEVHTIGGDNIMEGGDGNDTLYAENSGTNLLDGGSGDDELWSGGMGNSTLLGGEGNDKLRVSSVWNRPQQLVMDGGAGRDQLNIGVDDPGVSVTARGGSGADVFLLERAGGTVTIVDFNPAEGDQLNLNSLLPETPKSNPFGSLGYLKLEQSGSDVLLYVDADGAAGTMHAFRLAATLAGVDLKALTEAHIVGQFHPDGSYIGQTIIGTDGSDTLTGTARDDTIRGLGGADRIDGGAGDDLVEGGDGDDSISGGNGDDRLFGGAGNDTLFDESGGGVIDGGAGDDLITAGTRSANPDAVPGTMQVLGGAGNDTIHAALSVGAIDGGDGNDTIQVNQHGGATAPALRITAGDGDDLIILANSSNPSLVLRPIEASGGAGQDTYRFDSFATPLSLLTVTDFQAGAGGDVLDISAVFTNEFQSANPFGAAWNLLRMEQRGDDAVLQRNAAPSGDPALWLDVALLRNTAVGALTAENFSDGARPDGSPIGWERTGTAADDTMHGGRLDDRLRGADGNDTSLARTATISCMAKAATTTCRAAGATTSCGAATARTRSMAAKAATCSMAAPATTACIRAVPVTA